MLAFALLGCVATQGPLRDNPSLHWGTKTVALVEALKRAQFQLYASKEFISVTPSLVQITWASGDGLPPRQGVRMQWMSRRDGKLEFIEAPKVKGEGWAGPNVRGFVNLGFFPVHREIGSSDTAITKGNTDIGLLAQGDFSIQRVDRLLRSCVPLKAGMLSKRSRKKFVETNLMQPTKPEPPVPKLRLVRRVDISVGKLLVGSTIDRQLSSVAGFHVYALKHCPSEYKLSLFRHATFSAPNGKIVRAALLHYGTDDPNKFVELLETEGPYLQIQQIGLREDIGFLSSRMGTEMMSYVGEANETSIAAGGSMFSLDSRTEMSRDLSHEFFVFTHKSRKLHR